MGLPNDTAIEIPPASIPCNPLKVPRPLSDPASALVSDTIAHHGLTQIAAATMDLSKAQLNDVLRQKKGSSTSIALCVQYCLSIPGALLIRLQSQFDFQKA